MKTFLLFIFVVSIVTGQSFHTINIDGTNDFSASETITTSTSGYSAYITWDSDYLYLGYSGNDIGTSESNQKWIVFYFDTDPQLNPTSADDAGTSTAIGFNTQNWSLPFNADYMLKVRTDEGSNILNKFSGSSWVDSSTSGISFYDNDASNYIEIKIPLSKIGSPKQINLLGYFINETSFGEWTYGIFPSNSLSDGYYSSGNFTQYENYYLIGEVFQNIDNHINNFEWLIHLKASTATLADTNIYAGMGVNSTDDFDSGVDIAKPPAPASNYLEVLFSHPDWTTSLGPRFTRDVKKYISLDSTTSIWNFKISTDQTGQQVSVNPIDFDFIPANYGIKLYDAVADSTHDVRANGNYNYISASSAEERNFKLIIGTSLTSPNIGSNVSEINFGSVKTNETSTVNLSVSNSGDSTLIISNIISTNSTVFSFTGGTSYNITSNNSITIPITFSPNAALSYSEQLQILSNDPDTDTLFVALSGTGVSLAPDISVSSSILNYDSVKVDYDSTLTFKIYNTGDTTLAVSGINLSNSDFTFIGPTSFNIAVNDSVERSVKFSPTLVQNYTDSLQIFSNDPDQDTIAISLNGTGTAALFVKSFNAGWHLFSVPLLPDNNSASSVIGDDISQYFLLDYNRSTGYTNTDSIFAGNGYWLGIDSPTTIDVNGTPSVDSVIISAGEGWNLLATPYIRKYPASAMYFKKDADWITETAAVDSGWIQNVFYTYNETDSSYASVDTFSQWQGNWMLALSQNISTLFLHSQTTGTPLTKPKTEQIQSTWENWLVTINTENEFGRKDNLLKFGVNEYATAGFDVKYDFAKPPISPIQGSVQTYFEHNDWSPLINKFARDVQAPDNNELNNTWTFNVKSTVSGDVTLHWENIEQEYPVINPMGDVSLLLSSQIIPSGSLNMLSVQSHSFTFRAQANVVYEFIIRPIIVDVKETVIPLKFNLEQNYPNPFNPSTTINYQLPKNGFVVLSIYNVLGETVAELVNQFKPAGYYSINFDASNLSSGIYIYKLRIITQNNMEVYSDIKKMILLK